jgi:GTP-binding protein Era
MKTEQFKAGYLSLIGPPNVGKSTLLNSLLNYKLSITSPRPQTTRRRIIGIMSGPEYQVVVCDTPGFLKPKYKLQETFIQQINMALIDSDVVCLIIEIKKPEINPQILNAIKESSKPVILALNKIDQVDKPDLLPIIDDMHKQFSFTAIIPISAIKKDGIIELQKEIINWIPEHPAYYDSEFITDQPERFFVAELIREQIFLYFKHEIPYTAEVQIEEFKQRENKKKYILATIYTEKQSQKGILIGQHGNALKEIGMQARKKIEQLLGRPVYLELRVKIKKDWRQDEKQLKRFGY